MTLHSKGLPKLKERICGVKCGTRGAVWDRLGAKAEKMRGSGGHAAGETVERAWDWNWTELDLTLTVE